MNRMNPPPVARNVRDSGTARHTSAASSTSLPSIHQLHPFLPQTGSSQSTPYTSASYHPYSHGGGHSTSSSYGISNAPLTSSLSLSSGQPTEERSHEHFSLRRTTTRPLQMVEEDVGGVDSELEGEGVAERRESQEPPKKKRRRQALSCTECKRRKIKCDRIQPCGPCAKRGEPDKCQWHIVEPTDKYVSRAEWEDLHTRYARLEARYNRLESVFLDLHPELSHRFSPTLSSPGSSRHPRNSPSYAGRDVAAGVSYMPIHRTPPTGHSLSYRTSSTFGIAPSQSSTHSDEIHNDSSAITGKSSFIILEPEDSSSDNTAGPSPPYLVDTKTSNTLAEPTSGVTNRISPLSIKSIVSGPLQSEGPYIPTEKRSRPSLSPP